MHIRTFFVSIAAVMFFIALPAVAATPCDNQPKPAFGCPGDYEIMCIPVGGPHWGCGKQIGRYITEAPAICLPDDQTGVSAVTVRGWDPKVKKAMIGEACAELDSATTALKKKHDAAMAAIQNIR